MQQLDHLSSSQLRLYLQCPQKYQFQYIDLIPKTFRASALAFGSAIHSALSWFHKAELTGAKVSQEQLAKIFETDWYSQKADEDIHFKDSDDDMKLVVMGRELLSLYQRQPQRPQVKGSEIPFVIPLVSPTDGRELGINLEGYFDVIERDDTIVEFKTSAQVMTSFDIQSMMQLTAYGYAFKRLYGRPPKGFKVINFIKNKKPRIEVTETRRNDEDYEVFFHLVEQILKAITEGIFYPRAGFWCKECEYAHLCPLWQRKSA
ncbi:MAG: PD-(D/E)XK nuclease family protein [Ignavibacteriae bacterium]|nr:PD-(D/E)XK nuclease family protein [Ignavibacteria bacterium]MBI3365286.1 PD-(D/E)XK nuclease family protein [Ignavibacteriota bacterium]